MKRTVLGLLLLAASVILTGCHPHHHHSGHALPDSEVSIEVEIYDPRTGYVWEGVGVRVVEADQEWSGCTCVNPVRNDWYYSDAYGVVYFGARDLAIADVGFLEDGDGHAVLGADLREDEATVVLEVYAPGLGSVFREVELSWDQPRVFLRIPF